MSSYRDATAHLKKGRIYGERCVQYAFGDPEGKVDEKSRSDTRHETRLVHQQWRNMLRLPAFPSRQETLPKHGARWMRDGERRRREMDERWREMDERRREMAPRDGERRREMAPRDGVERRRQEMALRDGVEKWR